MIILGDNPFFGVNHASAAKSRAYFQSSRTRDWSSAHATMRAALASGVTDFMVSTHAEAPDLLASMQRDPELARFRIVPAVPYLHRLNGLVASKGVPAALMRSISYPTFAKSVLGGASLTAAGLDAFVTKEIEPIEHLGFEVPAIALQNIFVDLLLGLGLADVISDVGRKLSARGRRFVAITMNPTLADRQLDPSVTICTHYNHLGYMVQPNMPGFCDWLAKTARPVWAMGVLASGRAKLPDVMADPQLSGFEAVVVGASRPASIETFTAAYAARG